MSASPPEDSPTNGQGDRRPIERAWHAAVGVVRWTLGRPFRQREERDPATPDGDEASESAVIDDEGAGDADAVVAIVVPEPPPAPVGAEPGRARTPPRAPAASVRPTAPLPTGTIARTSPGAPWWRYRRPDRPTPRVEDGRGRRRQPKGPAHPVDGSSDRRDGKDGDHSEKVREPGAESGPTGIEGAALPPSGLAPGVVAALLLGIVLVGARFGAPGTVGRFLVPVAAVFAAVAFGKRLTRHHPDEPWLARLLVAGVVFKLAASGLRYYVLDTGFEGVGDAADYDTFGRRFSAMWFGDGPSFQLDNLRKTNFVRWFTGVVYEVLGPDMVMGFFVFGLLAFVGTYLWYRGTVTAVPFVNRRLYLALVLFAPSIAFWPSSIGKESLMQLGFGFVALGTAMLMHHRILPGLLVAAPGGWLLWVVRPHLLAMATIAAGLAYLVGRRTTREGASQGASLTRPIGAVILAFLVAFAVSAGAEGLGIEQLSVQGIEQELDETTEQTSQGGSKFESGENSLSPLTLPQGAVTVLLRPFPWEVDTGFQILSSLEGVALMVFIFYRRRSLLLSLRRARTTPFLLYCWTLMLIYAAAFSSFGNFGLLVRQRSLVLPALFVLLCLDAGKARAPGSGERSRSVTRGAPAPVGS